MQPEPSARTETVTESGSAEGFLGRMTEKLGATARAATIFGDPLGRNGVTVIPERKRAGVLAEVRVSGGMKTEPVAAAASRSYPSDSSN